MPYQFALNINDDNDTLSPTDGLEFGDLGVLIAHLKGAISDKTKCTLFKIENHGYTPHFVTDSKTLYNNFLEVHSNIYEKGISDLRKNEATYANTLKRILKGDKYVEVLDNDNNPVQKIYPSEIERSVESYFAVTNQSGIISEIGAQNINEASHIYLDGIEYKIFITGEQDALLRTHYKGSVIEFKVKQKRSVKTGKVISAKLIQFNLKNPATLHDSLSKLTIDDLSFLNGIQSHEDIIRLIRS